TVGRSDLVEGADAVVTAALNVERAQVGHAGEAVGHGRTVEAGRVRGRGNREQRRAELVVDLGVVGVLRLLAQRLQHRTHLQGLEDVRVEGNQVERHVDGDGAVAVVLHVGALGGQVGQV